MAENETEQQGIRTYDNLQNGARRQDDHTYECVKPAASARKSELVVSFRMIAVTAVCLLIMSALANTIAIVVYHTIIVKTHEETTSHRFNSLEETQANTSVHMETLTEEHNTTNRQLMILANKQNITGQQVAFSVNGLRQNRTIDDTALFFHIVINTGQYDTSSGIFTCTQAGLYYFSFSFEHDRGDIGEAKCYIMVNGGGYVYVAVQGPYEMASGSVIHHLAVDDTVKLYCRYEGWQYVRFGHRNSVFSGFLITPD